MVNENPLACAKGILNALALMGLVYVALWIWLGVRPVEVRTAGSSSYHERNR